MAGVKAGRAHLCRVAGNTGWMSKRWKLARIVKYSPSAPRITLVSDYLRVSQNLKGVTPIEGAKWDGVRKIGDFQRISRRISETGEIRPRLLLQGYYWSLIEHALDCYQSRLWMILNGRTVQMLRLSKLATEIWKKNHRRTLSGKNIAHGLYFQPI